MHTDGTEKPSCRDDRLKGLCKQINFAGFAFSWKFIRRASGASTAAWGRGEARGMTRKHRLPGGAWGETVACMQSCRKSRRVSTGFASRCEKRVSVCSLAQRLGAQCWQLRLMHTNNLVVYFKEWFGCGVSVLKYGEINESKQIIFRTKRASHTIHIPRMCAERLRRLTIIHFFSLFFLFPAHRRRSGISPCSIWPPIHPVCEVWAPHCCGSYASVCSVPSVHERATICRPLTRSR